MAQHTVAQRTAQPQVRMFTPQNLQQLQRRQQVWRKVKRLTAAALRLHQLSALTMFQRPLEQLIGSLQSIRIHLDLRRRHILGSQAGRWLLHCE